MRSFIFNVFFYTLKHMKILLIEDETNMRTFIKKGLQAELFIVEAAATGKEGIAMAHANHYDAVILDFHLPDMTGLQVVQAIRKAKPSLPVMVLSVEVDIDVKVEMLSICDDYVTKPFLLKEIAIRLHALSRRGTMLTENILRQGDVELDTNRHLVTLGGKPLQLRNKEFALLEYFIKNSGVVLSREMILERVWDMNIDLFTNTVDVHVRLLRKKIHSKNKEYIHTVPKRGYKFQA